MHSLLDEPATKSGELSQEELELSERLTKLRLAASGETHCRVCEKAFTNFRKETLPYRRSGVPQQVVQIGECNCTEQLPPG